MLRKWYECVIIAYIISRKRSQFRFDWFVQRIWHSSYQYYCSEWLCKLLSETVEDLKHCKEGLSLFEILSTFNDNSCNLLVRDKRSIDENVRSKFLPRCVWQKDNQTRNQNAAAVWPCWLATAMIRAISNGNRIQ